MNPPEPSRPEIACVVLSLRDQPGLVTAVRSLHDQVPRPEIVVVNSGGGDAGASLRAAGLSVPVVDRAERLFPGGARNLGIDATTARFVAFLAADCQAEPGWVAARIRAHNSGTGAVASTITNPSPESRSACAAHLLLYHRRMATTPPSLRLSYGLSYDRALFERFGRFREDLREGEDSEFNERIAAEVEVAWPTEVRTAHQNPTRPLPLLRAQFLRGRRSRFYKAKPMSTVVRIWLFRHPLNAILQAIRTPDPAERRRLVAAWPLVPPAGLAYAAGALSARCSDRPVSPRPSRGGEATTPPVLSQSTESGGSSERAA